jgi:anti-sigma factor RsiW
MSGHATPELLSAYLDDQLAPHQAVGLRRHLAECDACRRHLDSLHRVVAGLRGIERVAPPPVLDQLVQRRVALEEPPVGLLARVEARLDRFQTIQSSVGAIFAVVLALAAMVYFLAEGVERYEQKRIPVLVLPAVEEIESEESGGQSSVKDGDLGAEVMAESRREPLDEGPMQGLLTGADRIHLEVDPEIRVLSREVLELAREVAEMSSAAAPARGRTGDGTAD